MSLFEKHILHVSLQLSVQLQQSSEYWTQQVRKLSIELQKLKDEAREHAD